MRTVLVCSNVTSHHPSKSWRHSTNYVYSFVGKLAFLIWFAASLRFSFFPRAVGRVRNYTYSTYIISSKTATTSTSIYIIFEESRYLRIRLFVFDCYSSTRIVDFKFLGKIGESRQMRVSSYRPTLLKSRNK